MDATESLNVLDDDLYELRRALLSDFLSFTRAMFKLKTGREFIISQPDGNESHYLTISRELTNVFLLKSNRLAINCPPGWSKSELCKSFVCWAMAHYPDSKFLYISHSFDLAVHHTASIKQTMSMPLYKRLFGIEIRRDSSAKEFFHTTNGGAVAAFGSAGSITGHDGGLPGLDRFSGAVIIDDIHKPDEVHSDTIREKVKRNYFETIERRLRAPNVPIIFLGHRLHEDDLFAHLYAGVDGRDWNKVIIKGIDDAGNARFPEISPKADLNKMQELQPYVFHSQYQQEPIPAGGGLFQESWFQIFDETPNIIATFITADSAETEQEYNDATVFSFWGIYQIEINNTPIDGLYGLHWIDCLETRIEPKDLEPTFLEFWTGCMRYKVQPKFAAIEKKSTGVTLCSTLKNIQGLRILPIERSGAKNSKVNRYIEIQPFIANKQVSLPRDGKHTKMCIDHMKKITANNVHKWDDICDTAADAIKIALIEKSVLNSTVQPTDYNAVAKNLMSGFHKVQQLKKSAFSK